MTNTISAEFYFSLAILLIVYTVLVRAMIFVTHRVVYNESHPGHFASFLESSTVVAAVGIGMCLCFGTLLS